MAETAMLLRMRQLIIVTLVVLVLSCRAIAAIEKWSDPALPLKENVAIWLDATRQTAAWTANQRELAGGDSLDVFYDASGNHRDFSQPVRDAQPKIVIADQQQAAAVRFDGKDDHLRLFRQNATLENVTAFLVACVRSNGGEYRAFLAGNKTGTNDYHTGFNVDMGPFPTDGMTGVGFFQRRGQRLRRRAQPAQVGRAVRGFSRLHDHRERERSHRDRERPGDRPARTQAHKRLGGESHPRGALLLE